MVPIAPDWNSKLTLPQSKSLSSSTISSLLVTDVIAEKISHCAVHPLHIGSHQPPRHIEVMAYLLITLLLTISLKIPPLEAQYSRGGGAGSFEKIEIISTVPISPFKAACFILAKLLWYLLL